MPKQQTSFYTPDELQELGFKSVGKGVLLSRKTSIYGASKITLADDCRIDDFVILSGDITIGKRVHIAAFAALFAGDAGIDVGNYATISSRSTIYASSDDYSGTALIGPMVPEQFRDVEETKITLEPFAAIGASAVLLPGAYLETGSVLGSMSLLKKRAEAWKIYAGVPAKYVAERKKDILEKAACLERQEP